MPIARRHSRKPRLPLLFGLAACLLLSVPVQAETPAASAAVISTAVDNPAAPVSPAAESAQPAAASVSAADNLPAIPAAPAAAAPKHDLSPLGMYQNADAVVKGVMIGLLLASLLTWTVWLAKGFELVSQRRRLRRELALFRGQRSLEQASENLHGFSASLIDDARDELQLSAGIGDKDSIKERVSFRLERLVAASGRRMAVGTGVLATIGSVSPFVGLFGTVWGIMNSFIGIAETQTTNLAVVAPGIAEALLATALGLVAAIPAVVIYNVFARSIAGYRAQVADISAQVLLLVSRDLDRQPASPLRNLAKAG